MCLRGSVVRTDEERKRMTPMIVTNLVGRKVRVNSDTGWLEGVIVGVVYHPEEKKFCSLIELEPVNIGILTIPCELVYFVK